jgi:predicted ATPase
MRTSATVVPPVMVEGASGSAGETPHISTPDRRVRVFVSSTLQELAAERTAARSAITGLHLTPVMFELGARPHPPRELYRAYLAQSEVFVGIYWQQYGWVAPGEETSGLEDEYLLCGDKPRLIYVKAAPGRDARLTGLLTRIEADDGASYKPFDGAEDLAGLLADDLAVLLTERFTRSGEHPAQALRRAALPVPPTQIVDRRAETALVGDLLRDPSVHLVTLIGSGGIGKTRLAIEIARRWAEAVPGGAESAWFVDLAPVRDAALWVEALAGALGIRPEGSSAMLEPIIDRLQGRRALIVLDNFEHILAAARELGRFLTACPELTVLVTSRSPLRLRGEREIPLEPLEAPAAGVTDVEVAGRSAAVQLFVARAVAVRPGFKLTPANAAAVAELCRRLDGIPLALELAAVQLRILTPAALLARLGAGLDRALDLAAGPVDLPGRQRTLRATIEWSYGLLSEAQQVLLARLSVFTGAWTLTASEAVGSDGGDLDAVDTLAALVAQSLVRVDESDPDETRFRMLDTVRAYAAERLAERGETDATVARLARYLIGVVQAVRDDLQGPAHRAVARRLDRERDEIRSAIDWALKVDDAETVGWLLTPLLTYWWSRGLLPMTHDLAEKAAALPSAARLAPYASALLLGAQGMAMVVVGQTAEAEPLLAQTLKTATMLGNARLRAYALLGLGGALANRRAGEASQRLDDAAEAFRGTGDWWGLAITLSTRGQLALAAGDHAAAEAMHEEALAAAETVDNDYLRAQVLDMLGLDAATVGDMAAARTRYAAAAALHDRLLDYEGSANCLSGLADLALGHHKPLAAARLIGASGYARRTVGAAVWPGMQSIDKARRGAVTAALSPASFAAATAEGARMRIPDALGYGLAATAARQVPDPFPAWASRLRSAT